MTQAVHPSDNLGPFMGPGPDAQCHAHLANGEFRIQQCRDCGAYQFFPRMLCKACGSPNLTFVKAEGTGTVYSFTTIRNKPEAGGPQNFSIIELTEGPRLFSRVEQIDPEAVHIGMAVRARIVAGEDQPFVVFDPA